MLSQGGEFGPAWSAALRRTTERELGEWLEFALDCGAAAAPIALSAFQGELDPQVKADGSFATEADLRIETMLRDRIASRFPGHLVTGEEFGRDEPGDSPRWYVDPIDGTHNFMRGIPIFATLIAVECGGELQAGVIEAPALGQRWYAARGVGSWTSGGPGGAVPRRLGVSDIVRLDRAQVLYRETSDMAASRFPGGLPALERDTWRARGLGDFWGYALVADGAAELMVEQGLGPWDLAAPWVLVEEAGGRVTDFDGRRSLERGEGFASNGVLHDALLSRLRGEVQPAPPPR